MKYVKNKTDHKLWGISKLISADIGLFVTKYTDFMCLQLFLFDDSSSQKVKKDVSTFTDYWKSPDSLDTNNFQH